MTTPSSTASSSPPAGSGCACTWRAGRWTWGSPPAGSRRTPSWRTATRSSPAPSASSREQHDGVDVVVTVAPCSPFSVTGELMRESAELARRAVPGGLHLHTHLAETLDEERDALARFAKRPLDLLEELGLARRRRVAGPRDPLRRRRGRPPGGRGTGVAHCPSSNARLGSGIARVADLRRAGAPVGPRRRRVGVQRARVPVRRGPPGAVPGAAAPPGPDGADRRRRPRRRDRGGAACLGRDDIGELAVGKRADVAVWPAEDLADVPDALAGLVLGPERRVRHLLVGGRPVVTDGELAGLDLRAARAHLARRAARLFA